MTSTDRRTVAIIGAGHNGLTAAAYLARAGFKVTVFERRDIVGGACVTEEVWPGYRVSTAAYLCSLLHPTIIRDLNLKRFGLDIYRRETAGFAPFPDGSYLFLFADSEKTRAELRRFCPADVDAYFAFESDVERAAEILEPFFFGNPPPSLDQVADAFKKAAAEDIFEQFFTLSVRELLERRFSSDPLMAVLATDGLIGTAAGISDPGTAYVLLHHYMGRALGARGAWGYVRGGMGRISEAIADSARSYGAVIRVGAEVDRILLQDGRAVGVRLLTGEEIRADYVLSNADSATTYGLASSVASAEPGWKMIGVSCKINLAVSELPNFTCLPGAPGPQHLGTVHLSPSLDFLETAWADAREGKPSKRPMVEMYIQTATDPSLAPPGKHILSCFTQYFPYSADDRDQAESYYQTVLDIIAEYAPNVPDSIESRQILTPHALESRFGLSGGHIFHGDITPEQMFDRRLGPTTPVPGLLFCGSAAHPGGCVSGIPGYNAAQFLLTNR